MSLYKYLSNKFQQIQKLTHMMHVPSANHVRKTTHENNVLLGSYVPIAVLLASRMYHILEYVQRVPMYLEHVRSDVPSNQA
jgi:hypothetical protein